MTHIAIVSSRETCCMTISFVSLGEEEGAGFNLQNEIGWRNQSRKLLLFSTDAGFHYAGDGKVFGFILFFPHRPPHFM